MIKKQYFCLLALCAFVGINVTNSTYAGETQEKQQSSWRKKNRRVDQQRVTKQQRSCEEKCQNCVEKCEQKRAYRTKKGNYRSSNQNRQQTCEEKCSKCVENCQKRRSEREQRRSAKANGTPRKGDKRKRGYGQDYGRSWARSEHSHSQPGRPLYKQEQSMSPTAPSRRQMPVTQELSAMPYRAESINPASISYQAEQSEKVRMPRGYRQPMQQSERAPVPSAPVLPEPGLSDRETMLRMAPE